MKSGPIDAREAYATFNMGAGFAVYVDPQDASEFLRIAEQTHHDAWIAGNVLKQGDRKAVEIVPLQMAFEADTLAVR